jgi:hypothetical protein
MALDEKIISVDHDDDDGVDIRSFTKFVEEDTKRNKNKFAKDFMEIGEDLLAEVEIKKARKEIQKHKYIIYILKHDDNTTYSEKTLKSYSFEDVLNIYNELKTRGTFLQRVFRFIFNL